MLDVVAATMGFADGLSEALGAELGREFEKGCFTEKHVASYE